MLKEYHFKTKYNCEPSKGEVPMPGTKTEKTGYVPPKVRIQEMVLAGKRLAEARHEQFDSSYDEVPITRKRGVDLSEVIDAGKEASKRLETAKKKHKEELIKQANAKLREEIIAELGKNTAQPPNPEPPKI